MNSEPVKTYISQPVPVPESGKAFKVIFTDGTHTPLLTKADAEYVLSQYERYRELSLKSSIKKALKEQDDDLVKR